jgi:cell wall-associated NlpC family hydrolase
MNKLKIISVLTGGALLFSIPGCITKPTEAVASPQIKHVEYKIIDLVHTAKLNKNTAKMQEVLMKIFHRVNKTPYVFAGDSIKYGWDCSGMVVWTYEQFGIELPHSANKQAHVGKRVSSPKLGDIVVFAYNGSTNFYHSGIYIGKGKIVNANSYFRTTVIEPLTDYKNSQIRFVRIVPTI